MSQQEVGGFKRYPIYQPEAGEALRVAKAIALEFNREHGIGPIDVVPVDLGQGINFRLKCIRSGAGFALKIRQHSGYPSSKKLAEVTRILPSLLNIPQLVMSDDSEAIGPYGFVVSTWVDGQGSRPFGSLSDAEKLSYLDDIAALSKRLSNLRYSFVGELGGNLHWSSYTSYLENMMSDISFSFGGSLIGSPHLSELEEAGILSDGACDQIQAWIESLLPVVGEMDVGLVHGDLLPTNLIRTDAGPTLIDWDEARAGVWTYDVARL